MAETHPDTVLAFEPNKDDGLFWVAELSEHADAFGELRDGAQCQVCGNTEYRIERNGLMPKFGAARCEKCGQRYRIVHVPARDVVFPA